MLRFLLFLKILLKKRGDCDIIIINDYYFVGILLSDFLIKLKGSDGLYSVNDSAYKRYFSVPCALVDNYIKLADGNALKLILYLLSSEGSKDEEKISEATGLSPNEIEEAAMFWADLGVISEDGKKTSPAPVENVSAPQTQTVTKVVHARYQPKDIAEQLKSTPELRQMFFEAEETLQRVLNHADHEALMSLKESFGFNESAIILILQYCFELGKTSAKYYERVAEDLFEKGMNSFEEIEHEFDRRRELHSYENEVRNALGLDVKPSKKQLQYMEAWRDLGFGPEMIALAREKCVDALNKLSMPYIDKIIRSWSEKGIKTPEDAENEKKPDNASSQRSFDINEFDRFTLGEGEKK